MFSVILLIPPNYSKMCGHQLERGQPTRGLTTDKIWLSFSTSSCRLLIALQLGKKIHFYLSCLCLNFDCHTCMHVFFMLSQLLWVHLPCYILKSPFPCRHTPSRLLIIFPHSLLPGFLSLGRRVFLYIDVPFWLKIPYSLSWYIFMSVGVSCHQHLKQKKKFHWWGLKDAIIYGYKEVFLSSVAMEWTAKFMFGCKHVQKQIIISALG